MDRAMYMTFNQVQEEQRKPLDYKIDRAVEAIGEGFRVCRHTPALAFSGGKDSTLSAAIFRSRKKGFTSSMETPAWNTRRACISQENWGRIGAANAFTRSGL